MFPPAPGFFWAQTARKGQLSGTGWYASQILKEVQLDEGPPFPHHLSCQLPGSPHPPQGWEGARTRASESHTAGLKISRTTGLRPLDRPSFSQAVLVLKAQGRVRPRLSPKFLRPTPHLQSPTPKLSCPDDRGHPKPPTQVLTAPRAELPSKPSVWTQSPERELHIPRPFWETEAPDRQIPWLKHSPALRPSAPVLG